ncbi:MAG: hypothetical protein WCV62_03075 [Candidatus Peribacteraceae bacterium]
MTRLAPLGLLLNLVLTSSAHAMCPVCTIAAGAGVGLARWLGVDDTISGLWVGGMMVAIVGWTITWFNKKNIRFKGRIILTTLFYYVILLYLPLYFWTDLLTNPLNEVWGVNRLFLGTLVGSVVFLAAHLWYLSIKKKNGGRAWFPMQKVVWPLAALAITTLIFFFVIPPSLL